MKEALFWKDLPDKKVQCVLCPHTCVIFPGKRGFCKARANHSGVLVSESYGKVTSYAPDPIEKKPLYHFKPGSRVFSIGTYGCNLACDFCQNFEISQAESPPSVTFSSEEVVEAMRREECSGIAYTYSEPLTWYEFVLDTSKINEADNIIVTNGYINEEPLEHLVPHIDAANVDVKGGSEFYRTLCHSPYKNVMETVRTLYDSGVHVEATNLIIPGHNDGEDDLRTLCSELVEVSPDIPLHFSRFFPHYRITDVAPTAIDTLDKAASIAKEEGLNHVYLGNVWERDTSTTCPSCGTKLLDRNGFSVRGPAFDGTCPQCGAKLYGVWK